MCTVDEILIVKFKLHLQRKDFPCGLPPGVLWGDVNLIKNKNICKGKVIGEICTAKWQFSWAMYQKL